MKTVKQPSGKSVRKGTNPLLDPKFPIFVNSEKQMAIIPGKHLSKITFPEDLRKFDESELPEISKELRDYIIDIG